MTSSQRTCSRCSNLWAGPRCGSCESQRLPVDVDPIIVFVVLLAAGLCLKLAGVA